MHGKSVIDTKQTIKFINKELDFFEVDNINRFDLILGWNGIKKFRCGNKYKQNNIRGI